jgi:sulfur-carrier protein
MPTVHFTLNLRRHVECPVQTAAGKTVAEALGVVFAANPKLRGYVVDERGALRKHMAVFIDGHAAVDREGLSDAVGENSEIFVMQALSGG